MDVEAIKLITGLVLPTIGVANIGWILATDSNHEKNLEFWHNAITLYNVKLGRDIAEEMTKILQEDKTIGLSEANKAAQETLDDEKVHMKKTFWTWLWYRYTGNYKAIIRGNQAGLIKFLIEREYMGLADDASIKQSKHNCTNCGACVPEDRYLLHHMIFMIGDRRKRMLKKATKYL